MTCYCVRSFHAHGEQIQPGDKFEGDTDLVRDLVRSGKAVLEKAEMQKQLRESGVQRATTAGAPERATA